jgi:ABC-type transport system involved in multi-copper enzyme maturation permease subunit
MSAAFVALYSVGFFYAYRDWLRNTGLGDSLLATDAFVTSLLSAGLYVVNFLIVMMTVLTAVNSISGELSTNNIHAIASKPLHRWQIVLGKWLGHVILLTIYAIILSTGVMLSTYLISGFAPHHPIQVVGILILEGLAVLSLTLLGSTLLSTLANGVVVFMLYGIAFIGGFVEQLGALMSSNVAVDLGVVSSLLLPSEALWRVAADMLEPPLLSGVGTGIGPFGIMGSRPSPAFLWYSVIYTVVLLGLTVLSFNRQDF